MEATLRELRLAVRSLRRDPIFALTAILTLALGMGATTAVFSALNGVLLSPLPYPGGESLVRLYSTNPRQNIARGPMSPPDIWDFRAGRSIAAASPVLPYEGTFEDDAGNPIRIPAYAVSADFFEVFQLPMLHGRGFLAEEDEPGSPLEVVLSHQLWQTALGGDPSIVGGSVLLEGSSAVVVGIAPPEMRYPRDAALWALPGINWPNMARRGRTWDAVARLEPTTGIAQASTELSLIASRLEEEHTQWNRGVGVEVVPLKESMVGNLDVGLVILMAASVGLLLVAASNVANLLLARGAARLQETALRSALGASRGRIVGTLFAESFVTSVAGAVAGVVLALVGIRFFKRLAPPAVSILGDVTFGWRPLAFAGALTVGTAVIFGLVPAVRAASADIRSLLGDGGRRSTGGTGGSAVRALLVVAEVGVATALVIGAGLLLRSYQNISATDPGFDLRDAVVFNVSPPIGIYSSLEDVDPYYDALVADLEGVPGVEGVTTATVLPLGTEFDVIRPLRILDLPEPPLGEEPQAYLRHVEPSFFQVMDVPVLAGRAFTTTDTRDGAPVALVNEAFVRRHLPDGTAVGRRVSLTSSNFAPFGRIWESEVEVVGVVSDVRYASLAADVEPAIYFPRGQSSFRRRYVILATSGDPSSLLPDVRSRASAVDGQVAISGLGTLDGVMRASMVTERFTATLLTVFGIVGLVVAMVGIYGVVSYQAVARIREMAIRRSLGATEGTVVGLILVSGSRLWGVGIVVGLVGAFLLRGGLASQLYGVTAADPVVFVVAPAILAVVSLAATAIPAIRATRVQPAKILRDG